MYFDNLQALMLMDGHGFYVWTAYLVTCLVIVAMLAVPARRRRRLLLQLAGEQKRARGESGARGER